MTHGAGLAIGSAATDGDAGIEFVGGAGHRERLHGHETERFAGEIVIESPAVNNNLAGAGGQTHPRDGGLAPARAQVLRRFWLGNFNISHTRDFLLNTEN